MEKSLKFMASKTWCGMEMVDVPIANEAVVSGFG